MNRALPLSKDQVILIEQSEIDYMVDRMRAIQERQGNPEGVEMKSFGKAVALYSRTMPWPTFNTVKGLSSDDVDSIDGILDFYKSRGRKPQFEIVPSRVDSEMLKKLTERGFYQSGFTYRCTIPWSSYRLIGGIPALISKKFQRESS